MIGSGAINEREEHERSGTNALFMYAITRQKGLSRAATPLLGHKSCGQAEDIRATAAAGRRPRSPLWSGNYKKRWAAGSVFHLQALRLGGYLDNRKMLRHVLRHENNRIFVLILLYCVLVSLLKLCMAQADGAAAGANDNGKNI